MATTYTADRADSAVQPRTHIGLNHVSETFNVASALAVDDVIEMVWVPEGAIIHEVILSAGVLDSGAGIVLDVGDGGDTDRFIDGSTIGQAGGLDRLGTQGGHMHTYGSADTIDILVETGPGGTGQTDVDVSLTVIYSLQE